MVDKKSLEFIDDERTPREAEFNDRGKSWVWMVSSYPGERTTRSGVSYLMPRMYTMIKSISCKGVATDSDEVATP